MKTVDAARGCWPSILHHIGVDAHYLTGRHTACPLCGQGKDTFRFDDKNGDGTYFCGKCGAGRGIDFVMKYLSMPFAQAASRVDEIIGNADLSPISAKPEKDPRPLLRNIGKGLQPIIGTVAEDYLRNRGLQVSSDVLRFHPGLEYWERDNHGAHRKSGVFPAMVAPIFSPEGELLTYHITYLSNGQKAVVDSPKKIKPPIKPITGGAIRLHTYSDTLAVAEGIETALAVHQEYQMPVWATVSANGMESLVLPDDVRSVLIFADNDKSFAGQKAAYSLARQLTNQRKKVEVFVPEKSGTDFLDELLAEQNICTYEI